MKKYILFFFLPVLLIGLHACDEGRIYENAVVATGEGRTVKMTGRISGVDKWSGDYSVVVAGFDDKAIMPLFQRLFRYPNRIMMKSS